MKEFLYAFDISLSRTGLVIFNLNTFDPVVITSFPTKEGLSYGKRLNIIFKGVSKHLQELPASVVVLEDVFIRHNNSSKVLCMAQGLIRWMFKDKKQYCYMPKTCKATILHGNATKKQIQNTLLLKYPDINFSNEDESDAFSIGLTYFIKEKRMHWQKTVRKELKNKKKSRL
ncbi:crossover junction endodeoxyribonuclease RuvC [Paenibacillus larvae]|uniref:crossover junction endodeoxyribonuclease RuvC n=1 Tax=Paenibacillus larvae TaxID=1464 RepID=UPI0018DCB1A7|nr:crossover junction endodeoxyribonuclease RuvC [Paenibacillus larvae]